VILTSVDLRRAGMAGLRSLRDRLAIARATKNNRSVATLMKQISMLRASLASSTPRAQRAR
jgi:hypothetical protein